MSAQIAPGTIVYSRHGHEAEYVMTMPNGMHAVRPGHEEYSCDPEVGSQTVYEGLAEWPEVFLKPPTEKLHAEVAALQEQIEQLQRRLIEVREKDRQAETEIQARMARLKQHEKLAYLDDFIAGKVTHYVIEQQYGDKKLSITEIGKTESQYAEGCGLARVRLLCLFGESKGDISWNINQYSDGSSTSWTTVHPCTSLQQAQQVAAKLYNAQLEKWRAEHLNDGKLKPSHWSHNALIETATHLGLPVAEDLTAYVQERRVKRYAEMVGKAVKELAELEQDYATVLAGGEPRSVVPARPY